MNEGRGRDLLAVIAVAAASILPWAGVIAGVHLPVPDDVFASDLADGEWPARVEAGRLLFEGGPWAWTDGIQLGFALSPDPWNLLYALLPPVTALGVHWALLLAIATTGGFALARQHGASRPAAALAAFGFAWSGFFVSQLRHLNVMGVVVWFPLALCLIERAAASRGPDRALWALAFGGVFGLQILAGFPQTAYYCGLVYAGLVVARAVEEARRGDAIGALSFCGAVGGATVLAAGVGLASVLPLQELGALSDRSAGVGWEFASKFPYFLPDLIGIALPYATGDVGRGTYLGGAQAIFWEDHGYVGLLAAVFAALYVASGGLRTFVGRFWAVSGIGALLVVLGPATPVYRFIYEYFPLMGSFRFPTRFLFVVELALVQCAAHGLDALLAEKPAIRRFAWGIVAIYALDLVFWNRRQIPLADADRWLETPTVAALADRPRERVYPRGAMERHILAFQEARGWADLEPYYAHRASLQPNANLLDGWPAVTGYTGIAPAGVLDLVGAFERPGLLQTLDARPDLVAQVLDLLGARYVVTDATWTVEGVRSTDPIGPLVLLDRDGAARVRVVRSAVTLPDRQSVEDAMEAGLNLRTTAVLPPGVPLPPLSPGVSTARITADTVDRLAIDVDGDGPGILVVGDAWYPGWIATVDGAPADVLRVDLGLRGVPVDAGPHQVELLWTAPTARRGVALSSASAALIGILAAAAAISRAYSAGSTGGKLPITSA